MKGILKYTVYINLIVCILSIFMAFSKWSVDRSRAYLFLFLAAVTGFNFFFRRHYQKKFEARKRENDN